LGKEIVNSQTQTLNYLSTFLDILGFFFDNGGGGIRKIQPQNMDPKCVSECQGENKQEIGAKIMLGHWPH
jgi:hypothetical protein